MPSVSSDALQIIVLYSSIHLPFHLSLVLYLVALSGVIALLQLTLNDALICPLVTYVLVSSFVVLVCVHNCRCCSVKQVYHQPLPKLIDQFDPMPAQGSQIHQQNVIYIVLEQIRNDVANPRSRIS